MKKGALRNFKKFTGKQLCQSLFFNKVAGLKPAILLKKRLWDRCFPVNFVKSLTTPFTEHFWATASEGIFKFPHHLMITMIIIRVHLKKKLITETGAHQSSNSANFWQIFCENISRVQFNYVFFDIPNVKGHFFNKLSQF